MQACSKGFRDEGLAYQQRGDRIGRYVFQPPGASLAIITSEL